LTPLWGRSLFGKDYQPGLQKLKENGAGKRIEELLERATQYTNVKTPWGDSVADLAGNALNELRHLAIGKVAPDIVGPDQDGVRFKLSDYRGKVVLLYFWSDL